MSLDPLFEAGPVIAAHAFTAMAAVILGALNLSLEKGTWQHIWAGRIWIALMAAVALSSFWIHELRVVGLWSPIHLLSILTLSTLVYSWLAIRAGNVRGHKSSMISLFIFALLTAGAFTFLPGRVMHEVLLGG